MRVADGSLLVGFKSEWASVKEHRLYVGSVGKEWTTSGGELLNYNPMWIKTVSLSGQVTHIDWEVQYKTLRQAVGVEFPGKQLSDCRRALIFIAVGMFDEWKTGLIPSNIVLNLEKSLFEAYYLG